MSRQRQTSLVEIMRPVLIGEIRRARNYIGSAVTPEEEKKLQGLPGESLMEEARAAGVAVELHQKAEAAEYMRRVIAVQEFPIPQARGPLS